MPKQLTPEDLRARSQRVAALPHSIPLHQADPAHIRLFENLTDVKLRSIKEPQWGIYIAESSKVIRRAVASGHQPIAFVMSEKWADDLSDLLQEHSEIPAYIGSEEDLESTVGYHLHRGALAAMRRPAPVSLTDLLKDARRVAVLEDVVDHTNVGAIFRSAAALDVDAVLVSPRCADPLYRRSIRVSMGNVFQVPWARLEDWPGAIERLREMGFVTAAMALEEDSLTLTELSQRNDEKLAIVLGTEGHGLRRSTLQATDYTVMIPMSHGVDSLNVAAASAVTFWETRPRK